LFPIKPIRKLGNRSKREDHRVRISAKADYAVRATVELASHDESRPVKGDDLAAAQDIPLNFLENILRELRNARIVRSQRGTQGGYWLARAAESITIADVIRAVEGPIADVRGVRPDQLEYAGTSKALRDVWVAARANLRAVLEHVTIADVAANSLPDIVSKLTSDRAAWE
jgi:Rrf2 family protein